MYLNFDQYRATILKDFLPGFYTLQNNDKCSILLIKKVAFRPPWVCVFRMLLVGLFDQFQLFPFIALDHFHDVHARAVVTTDLQALIGRQVVEQFHYPSVKIHYSNLYFFYPVTALNVYSKLVGTWVWIGFEVKDTLFYNWH
jgi:hypothetical protein